MDWKTIEKCHTKNPDGIGVAWFDYDLGKVLFKKGMKPDEAFKFIQDKPLPFVMHFRNWSYGGVDPLLTHPFIISRKSPLSLDGQADKVLFHNGTIKSFDCLLASAKIYSWNTPMSDSRAVAMLISNGNEYLLNKLKGYFVVMDATVKKTDKIKPIRLYGNLKFDEQDGILFSNTIWNWSSCTTVYSYDDGEDWSRYAVVEKQEVFSPNLHLSKSKRKKLARDEKRRKAYEKWWEDNKPEWINAKTGAEFKALNRKAYEYANQVANKSDESSNTIKITVPAIVEAEIVPPENDALEAVSRRIHEQVPPSDSAIWDAAQEVLKGKAKTEDIIGLNGGFPRIKMLNHPNDDNKAFH